MRNFGSSDFGGGAGSGGGNVDDRQLIAQLVSDAGRWWLPWWPAGNEQRTPSQSSLVHKSM